MKFQQRFTDQQLEKIIDEATIYMCACPAQVAQQISRLRSLIRYQEECDAQVNSDSVVHKTIASAGREAFVILEDCLDKILDLEGWDRETMTMPEGLRVRRNKIVNKD